MRDTTTPQLLAASTGRSAPTRAQRGEGYAEALRAGVRVHPIAIYDATHLDAQLDLANANMVAAGVEIDDGRRTITVPLVFRWYAADSDGLHGVRAFLLRYAGHTEPEAFKSAFVSTGNRLGAKQGCAPSRPLRLCAVRRHRIWRDGTKLSHGCSPRPPGRDRAACECGAFTACGPD